MVYKWCETSAQVSFSKVEVHKSTELKSIYNFIKFILAWIWRIWAQQYHTKYGGVGLKLTNLSFSVAKVTLHSQMSVCLSVCLQNPETA